MRLALLGYPIKHSLSPKLYQEILGTRLKSYELLEIKEASTIPSLKELAESLDGLNITTPYKMHFLDQVIIEDPIVQKIQAVNVLAFENGKVYATNTDRVAVEKILLNHLHAYKKLSLIILGSGVMARMTKLIADSLGIDTKVFSRSKGDDLTHLNLRNFHSSEKTIVVNACSRDFVFQGELAPEMIFWDYNYNFQPHQDLIPSLVSSYQDGREMLKLQAEAAVEFWQETTTKHKC